jgi:hypothetical protein
MMQAAKLPENVSCSHHCRPAISRASFSTPMLPSLARSARSRRHSLLCASSSTLLGKKCVPCENDRGSLGYMGLCESLSRSQAESMLASEVCLSPFGLFTACCEGRASR